jgi:hypothetical protein
MAPADLVPREEKEQARDLLAKYLTDNPITVS